MSIPTQRRPSRSAAAIVVPHPQKGVQPCPRLSLGEYPKQNDMHGYGESLETHEFWPDQKTHEFWPNGQESCGYTWKLYA